MGSIKNNTSNAAPHELTEEEFNYIMNVNKAKENIVQEYNRVLSAFMHYISCSRMGYDSKDDLQFEIDFTDEKRILKITKV